MIVFSVFNVISLIYEVHIIITGLMKRVWLLYELKDFVCGFV